MIKYVGKPETRVNEPLEWGDAPNPGNRNDIQRLNETLREKPHAGLMELADEHRCVPRFVSYVLKVQLESQQPRKLEDDCEGIWYYGAPGKGQLNLSTTLVD